MANESVEIVPMGEVCRWADSLSAAGISERALFLLFGEGRARCCSDAAVIRIKGKIVAAASIAPRGECGDGVLRRATKTPEVAAKAERMGLVQSAGPPSIIGVFVHPSHRRQGYGKKVVVAAIQRCMGEGLMPVSIRAMTTGMVMLIQSLPAELAGSLSVTIDDPPLNALFD